MKRFFALGLVVLLSTWSSLIESMRAGTDPTAPKRTAQETLRRRQTVRA